MTPTQPLPPPLWSATTLATLCGGGIDGALSCAPPITGLSIDTRSLNSGDLFVALTDQRDGHDFVTAAFRAGAAAALVAATYTRRDGDGLLIRVPDPLRALQDAGRIARFRTDAKVVAVTGSVGKTGTKEMLRQCLTRVGATHASEKSYNNHWGVPLTLARMPADTAYGVFEIGMSNPGEIGPLVRMVAPDVGIITTVEAVHLAQFSSVAEIAEAKAELLEGVAAGGAAILNRDNRFFGLLAQRAADHGLQVVSFGADPAADVRLTSLETSDAGSIIAVSVHGAPVAFRLGAPGRHYAINALSVVAALASVSADLAQCLPALAATTAPAGRGARAELALGTGKLLLIDESYNANPASMAAALATLATVPRSQFGRRLAVLGDMRELGADADAFHQSLASAVTAAEVDLVFACGPHMRALYEALPPGRRGVYAASSMELGAALVAALRPGDAVMVKGSLGSRMGRLVDAIRRSAETSSPA